ncbi:MAG TPA: ABC transporter permease [Candidatus Acidoferrales bacterium]|nr:ABC transporter permease [Candidatus Acidoferrales bacterium]
MTSASNVLPESAALARPHVLRIAPPSRWWILPIGELWTYRELLYFFVWRDIKIRYKQTIIGAAWAVLQPLLAMAVFTLFFGRLAHLSSDGLPYQVFSYCGLLPWLYFAASLQSSTNSIVENQRLVTKVYFPRLALPIASVFASLVDFAISFVMFAVLMAYYHIHPSISFVWFPAFLLLAILTAMGVGMWLSALNALYRDVRYVLPFLIQLWLFASPVVYSSSMIKPKWRSLYGLNPMAGVIDGFRWSLTGHGQPPGGMVFVSAVAVILILVGGAAYFQKMDTTIADVV